MAAVYCGGLLMAQKQAYTPEMAAFHRISAHNIYGYVEEMCKPEYNGRLAGSGEFMACAHWAANLFAEWGLKPGGDQGTYFQYFEMPYTEILAPAQLTLLKPGPRKTYRVADDFFPGTNTKSGTLKAAVVYAGFGLTAPELKYDDYQGLDVKGKIVLIESGVPCTDRKDKNYEIWNTDYISTTGKIANAIRHGAAAVLLIGKSSNPNIRYQDAIYYHVSQEIADDILKTSGKKQAELKKQMQSTLKPAGFDTGCEMAISVKSRHNPHSSSCNIIGVLEGTDPELRQQPVILGAHLDHLGNPGAIFRGAWDNASGSSIVLETARALAESGLQPKRTIIIILFSAEECGMVGSNTYLKRPLYPLDKTLCMINLDMVGDGDGLYMGGVQSFPEIEQHFKAANDKYIHRNFRTTPYRKSTGYPRTDGAIFSKADVTAFHTGTMGESRNPMYYHDPADVPETLSPEIMEDAARLLFLGLYNLCK